MVEDFLSFFDARRIEDEDQLDQTTKIVKSEMVSWRLLSIFIPYHGCPEYFFE